MLGCKQFIVWKGLLQGSVGQGVMILLSLASRGPGRMSVVRLRPRRGYTEDGVALVARPELNLGASSPRYP